MKIYVLTVALVASSLVAFGNSQNSNAKTNAVKQVSSETQQQNNGMNAVVNYYLQIKNALASDKSDEAAKAGAQLKSALVSFGKQSMAKMTKKQMDAYSDIAPAAEENAEHISKNGGDIDHQREHFQSLSKEIYILVKVFGTSQTLYKDYCPMKKSIWLSETKDIKNPYFGQSMPSCGTIKDTIKKQ